MWEVFFIVKDACFLINHQPNTQSVKYFKQITLNESCLVLNIIEVLVLNVIQLTIKACFFFVLIKLYLIVQHKRLELVFITFILIIYYKTEQKIKLCS